MVRALHVLPLTATALAAYTGNVNYFSPSLHHPSLGVSINKVAKRSSAGSSWDPAQLNFTHGVASGDPYEDSVILWTRISPSSDNDQSNVTVSGTAGLYNHDTDFYVAQSSAPVCVDWKISSTDDFAETADEGTAFTSSDIDYTVKVEAKKLLPFTTYYYQFTVCGSENASPVGRTKTIPSKDSSVDTAIRLAVYSCSNYRRSSLIKFALLMLTVSRLKRLDFSMRTETP